MSSENGPKLVRMANQIAAFFHPYPHEKGVAGVRDHIRSFWTPAMRRDLCAFTSDKTDGVDPVVVEALTAFRGGESPVARAKEGPDELGQIESDAG